jgi:hypothetical protein
MKVNEVTSRARVTRSSGNEIEIDNGDGTSTTIDTRKNPNALQRDAQGKLKVNKNTNSAMKNNSRQNQAPRAGEQVDIEDED